jgi:hypothetical protein
VFVPKGPSPLQAIARWQNEGAFDLQLLRRMQAHDPETLKLLFRKGEVY